MALVLLDGEGVLRLHETDLYNRRSKILKEKIEIQRSLGGKKTGVFEISKEL